MRKRKPLTECQIFLPCRPDASHNLLGHTKLESTVRYLGIEVDDALEIAEQTGILWYRQARPEGLPARSGQSALRSTAVVARAAGDVVAFLAATVNLLSPVRPDL